MRPAILQMCPLLSFLEEKLAARFDVHRWFDQRGVDDWLAEHGAAVCGVVTGGHLGISNDLMDKLPNLGVVAINGVGFDKVDLGYAKGRSIRVSITPGALTDDVADLAVGMILSLIRGISRGDAFVRANQWPSGEMALARKVSGRRFGIVGLGRIGQAIASRLSAFGSVAYTGPHKKPVGYSYYPEPVSLAEASDVLVLAAAANETTRRMIGKEVLESLGPEGYLINVARGSLVDEMALIAALRDNRIAGAALDVFADEPRVPVEFMGLPNVLLTPHIGSATKETREAMADVVMANLVAFFGNSPMPSALI
jgi:lactate dehydrogenase-like 2-hydroxyacid dehydrogenase